MESNKKTAKKKKRNVGKINETPSINDILEVSREMAKKEHPLVKRKY